MIFNDMLTPTPIPNILKNYPLFKMKFLKIKGF